MDDDAIHMLTFPRPPATLDIEMHSYSWCHHAHHCHPLQTHPNQTKQQTTRARAQCLNKIESVDMLLFSMAHGIALALLTAVGGTSAAPVVQLLRL